jgi:hypothetical protein
VNPGSLERRHLFVGGTLSPGNYSAGVAHSPAGWGSLATDETDDRLTDMIANKISGFFLRGASNLSDHHNGGGVRVLLEQGEDVDECRPYDWIAAYSDCRGLTHAQFGNLMDRLIGEGPAPGNDADLSGRMNASRHNSEFAFAR